MKHLYTYLLILSSIILIQPLAAQKNVSDSSITISSISIHYMYQFSGADMATRFGNNNNLGIEYTLKLKSNFILGADISYLFGNKVNNEESYFSAIKTSKDYLIDGNGQYAEVHLYERGFHAFAYTGYQFSFLSPNPNSGPFIQLGAGFLQHYVRIENPGNAAPQIFGEYKKLYDRLSNGFSTTQTIGYRHMGNHNLANFYIGFELTEAWTKSRRSYNADDLQQNNADKFNLLFGIKAAWILPLYGRAPKDFYYY